MRPWLVVALIVAALLAVLEARRRTLRATLEREEGRVPYIYRDSAGIETFGIGHRVLPTDRDLRQYSKSNPAPDAVIDAYFEQDIARAAAAVDLLSLEAGVSLTDNERAALVSLVFNIGTGAFEKSTLRRKLLAGDKAAAADEFLRWKFAGGEPVLLARRARERQLFLSDGFA